MPELSPLSDPAAVRLLVLDVDGVLTDGSILLDDHGVETKRFHVRDGLAIKAAMSQGIEVAVLTARSSRAVAIRMRELGVARLTQGSANKRVDLEAIAQQAGVALSATAYMGDDLQDLPALRACGYRLTVADAAAEVRAVADYVTQAPGGRGAVREAVEHLLKAQGTWAVVVGKG